MRSSPPHPHGLLPTPTSPPQGTLIVMLAFMGLELLMAAYTSVFWYRQICSAKPGVSTLFCHVVPAVSAPCLRADDPGPKSGTKKSQLSVMRCMYNERVKELNEWVKESNE